MATGSERGGDPAKQRRNKMATSEERDKEQLLLNSSLYSSSSILAYDVIGEWLKRVCSYAVFANTKIDSSA